MKNKKILIIILLVIIAIIGIISLLFKDTHKRPLSVYSPEKAITYSYEYVENRNPKYPNFESNCITYISQCLVAGGFEMEGKNVDSLSKTKVVPTSNKWFCYSFDNDPYLPLNYYVSSSFSNCDDFIKYWTKHTDIKTDVIDNTSRNINSLKDKIHIGDVLILYGKNTHSALVVKIDEKDIYYNSNTNDRIEYPLSRVQENEYKTIRYLNFVT